MDNCALSNNIQTQSYTQYFRVHYHYNCLCSSYFHSHNLNFQKINEVVVQEKEFEAHQANLLIMLAEMNLKYTLSLSKSFPDIQTTKCFFNFIFDEEGNFQNKYSNQSLMQISFVEYTSFNSEIRKAGGWYNFHSIFFVGHNKRFR